MDSMIDGVITTQLKIVNVAGGNVLHAMKESDQGYKGFGEVYFSMVENSAIKGWKCHKEMTLNLIVPIGIVRIVMFDDRNYSSTNGMYQEIVLSRKNYKRLTVPL